MDEYNDEKKGYEPPRARNPAQRTFDEAFGDRSGDRQSAPPRPSLTVKDVKKAVEVVKRLSDIISAEDEEPGDSVYTDGGEILEDMMSKAAYDISVKKKLKNYVVRLTKQPPFRWTNSFTWFRSWVSGPDLQGQALIFIYSYRGNSSITGNVVSPKTSFSVQTYQGPANQMQRAQLYINSVLRPSAATANERETDWTVRIADASLDMTLTNQGLQGDYITRNASIAATDPDTARGIEYDLRFVYPASGLISDPSQSILSLQDMSVKSQAYEQPYGNNIVGTTDFPFSITVNPSWTPEMPPFLKKYCHIRKIGSGTIPLGGSVRVLRHFRPSLKMTKKIYDADRALPISTMAHKPGLTACVLVSWRGTPRADGRDFLSGTGRRTFPSRLAFTVTNTAKYAISSNLQTGGRATNWQY